LTQGRKALFQFLDLAVHFADQASYSSGGDTSLPDQSVENVLGFTGSKSA
jgi:hypothetical protein